MADNIQDKRRNSFKGYASSDSSDSTTLEDKIHQIFFRVYKNLNIIHLNAQSVPAHYLDLLYTFSTAHNVDAILISETFLKPSMPSTDYKLLGFDLIRNDREGKGGGGIAIYLRRGISYNIVTRSPNDYSNSAEHLFIEIFSKGTKLLIGVYYSPSLTIDYFPSFQSLLQTHRSTYEHMLILGDFNTCLLKNDKRARTLLSILDTNNLSILPLQPTHLAPGSKPSLLDLIIVSDMNRVAKHGQLTGSFSHHDIIFVSYNVESPKRKLCSNFVIETFPSVSNAPERPTNLWKTMPVQQTLAQQMKAKRKYKRKRTPSALLELQYSRKIVKKLVTQSKVTLLASSRNIRKTKCHLCEPSTSQKRKCPLKKKQ